MLKMHIRVIKQLKEKVMGLNLKAIESKGIDFSDYEGTKSTIAKTEIIEVLKDYNDEGDFQRGLQRKTRVLRVATAPVLEIETKEGEKKQVSASEIFNLREEGKDLGYSTSPKGKLQKFLKKQNCDNPDKLLGTKVTLRVRAKENADGTKSEFLGFITE